MTAALIGIPTGSNTAPRTTTAPRTRLRLTRRGRVVFTTLAALPVVAAIAVLSISAGNAIASGPDIGAAGQGASFTYVTVDAGESLWQLAKSIAPTADPRDVVADIINLNQLTSSGVEPGQRLAIPIKYTD
ncbi:LysM peptidoglycan-binding domain-containing protein [Plantibacter sp. Mn2098]|uniref:LysM peptidoglycan-binding domain-containing protein n=1 Tax=Plantibacter sp. Mn2098 TaxID=3395266 RepID=UPI003BDE4264